MNKPPWIALWAIALFGVSAFVAVYVLTDDPGAAVAERAAEPTTAPPPELPPPAARATPPPLRQDAGAKPPGAAPPQPAGGLETIPFSGDPRLRAQELAAIRAQRTRRMMDQLNRRSDQVAAERSAAAERSGARP